LSRKTFKHNFVPFVELSTENINGQRYYVLPDGVTKLKSVTTIIGEKSDKTALLEWKKKVGEAEANRIANQAARRGTSVHKIAENYLLNEENFYGKEMPANMDTFREHFKPILDEHVDNIFGIELPLYSKALKCAGRTDVIAEYDGKLSIIDFKTSRKPKREEWIENYFIQSTVYSMMFEWTYKIAVPQIAIIIAVDDDKPQTFIKDRSLYVDRVLEMFRSDLV
jgi:genome maintenance exonuclease 1